MAGAKQDIKKKIRQNDEARERASKVDKKEDRRIMKFPFFKKAKPREKYWFFSDYFQCDDSFGTVLTVFHDDGADDNLGVFWGINLIPRGLDADISFRKMEHVARVPDSWVETHQAKAEGLLETASREVSTDGSFSDKARHSKKQTQLVTIAQDMNSGASYLRVSIRVLIKAPTLDKLDNAVKRINRQYKDRFETVYAAPYIGEQKTEMSGIFSPVDRKIGRNFMFTSAEFAGNYNLVTHGIEDFSGEYIGTMTGDVNNSVVLMDLDAYESHVVLAGRGRARTLSRLDFGKERGVDVWGTKLGFCGLMNNQRVIHLVLNGSDVANIGVDLDDITSVVNMGKGDINMFEMFGDVDDEMSIFPAQMEKLKLMAEQAYECTDADRGVIRGSLEDVATEFYVDKGMWADNAQYNRELLRVTGIPHDQVPRLPEFVTYLDMRYEGLANKKARDDEMLHAFNILRLVFTNMLNTNGDLFNTTTSDIIDEAAHGARVVYDFSKLLERGRGVAMAQFINALGFAVGSLQDGDVVILHGIDEIDDNIKGYVKGQFERIMNKNARVVYIYSSVNKMIADKAFNEFDSADYTMINGMTPGLVAEYQQALHQEVPSALKSVIITKDPMVWYLRRGFDNVVFSCDVMMGTDKTIDMRGA